MLGLDLRPKRILNLARVVGGQSRKPSKTVNVPSHHSLRKRRKQVLEMAFFARTGELLHAAQLHPALLRLSAMISQSFTAMLSLARLLKTRSWRAL
jgi:hypothetical protein